MPLLTQYLVIGLGGALGSMLRFGVGSLIDGALSKGTGPIFPWGTIIVNITGCFVIGFIFTISVAEGRLMLSPLTRNFITIGILGQDHFNDSLTNAVAGKNINGRTIVIKHVSSDDDLGGCTILFISSSEDSRLGEILDKTGSLPILTVGEDESFWEKGGIINFTLEAEKIRIEVNLSAAQKVKLQISSKLLSVAATVKK